MSYKAKSKRAKGPNRLAKLKIRLKKAVGMNIYLCESCKWNWRSACHNPARPKATWCPDYEKRGK